MPRGVPKQKRRRIAALQVAEPSRKEPPAATIAISHSGHGIAELASQLAELSRLNIDMDTAENRAERALKKADECSTTDTDAHAARCQTHSRFAEMQRHAYAKAQALEQLILDLEPTTASETLSLAVLFSTWLDVFVAKHAKDAIEYDDTRREWERLERAVRAVIRGIICSTGADSPLTAYHTAAGDLVPWADAKCTATREACRFLVEYSSATGKLKQLAAGAAQ